MLRWHRCAIACLASLAVILLTQMVQGGAEDELKPVSCAQRGTLKGQVTLAGPKPDIITLNKSILTQVDANKDKAECLMGNQDEVDQQTWRISDKGGVANVVVYVRPPEKSYFKLEASDLDPAKRGWKPEVVMDQPHCAFLPHVVVLFPSYYDPATGKVASTKQVFKIKNSAAMPHNSKWGGTSKNPGGNPLIPPGSEVTLDIVPDRSAVPVACALHGWMNAWIWAFDHPFAAITDKDGNYEIKNVPAGVELRIYAWHEEPGFLHQGGFKGEPIQIQPGMTLEKSFPVKPAK